MVADAQTDPIGEDRFDVLISQFGLMFFDDPEGGFVNLRRAMSPGGRVAFTCWQGLDENEWLTVVSSAVARHAEVPELGGLARGPGMFALKDPEETTALLTAAGFTQAVAEPLTTKMLIAGGGPPEESVEFLLGMGMVRGLLDRLDEDSLVAAVEEIRAAVADKHEPSVGTHLGAAGWLVSART
jgi:SAM-dependent methyltransferase